MTGGTDRPLERSSTPLVRRPRARFVAGRTMQVLAVVGLLIAVVAPVVGWRLVGRFERTLDESLTIVGDSLVTLEDTIALADELIDGVSDGLIATEEALDAAVTSFDDAEALVAELDTLIGEVAPTIENVASAVGDVADVGATIDDVLGRLGDLPFGPDYDPATPLGEELGRIADDLSPVASSLTDTSSELGTLVSGTDDLATEVGALADAVGQVNDDLAGSGVLLDQYLASTRSAQELADTARDDLEGDVALARVLIVVLAIVVALGQIVPYWYGTELVLASRRATPAAG